MADKGLKKSAPSAAGPGGGGGFARARGARAQRAKERAAQVIFAAAASVSVLAVALICLFIFVNGVPPMARIGVLDFLTGEKWKPGSGIYGVMPMILGSLYVTAGAMAVGVPPGILTAVYLARFARPRAVRLMKPAVSLLAGIPSVVYGFFGLTVLVPMIRELFGGSGSSMLAASLLLGMMILPTVISLSEAALGAVPASYYEGALALGATHERAVFRILLPAAKSGVMAGVVLAVGRAIGEAMAVMMVAGNQARMPQGLLKGVRTLTSNIALEMGYAADLHREALIATGVVLFVFILMINLLLAAIKRRAEK
jgi:phosphate transport system permease protein